MATKKEIEEQVKIALDEIGEIKPWFDKNLNKCSRNPSPLGEGQVSFLYLIFIFFLFFLSFYSQ